MNSLRGKAANAAGPAAKPLLVIDPDVRDADCLIADLSDSVDILLLVPGRSGLGQIADFLADRRDVPALHILSHGRPGALMLAGSRIDLAALVLSHQTLETIGGALGPDARVVLYGCSVLAGPKGASFARFLSVVLRAEISGSLMPVGNLALGGDWILRDAQGDWVEPIFSAQARAVYPGLLNGMAITGTAITGTAITGTTITGTAGDGNTVSLAGVPLGDPQSGWFAFS